MEKAAKSMQVWLPIKSAPKDGTAILVGRDYENSQSYSVARFSGNEWRDVGDIGWAGMYGEDNQPTHWMPIKPIAKG